MAPEDILDQQNPRMAMVWKTARGCFKKNLRKRSEILSVNVPRICDDLKTVLARPKSKPDCRTYYKASMIASGALRVHNMQTDLLLGDTKKLLNTMRREKKTMKHFDQNLDCLDFRGKVVDLEVLEPPREEGDFGASPRATRPTTISTSTSKVIQPDWSILDGDIDWAQGPPRARMQDITMPDDDVPPSPMYLAELERLRAVEGTLEGPTLLDWEEMNGEGALHPGEEKTEQSMTEAPIDILTPGEAEQPALSRLEVEEAPVEPPIVEEPEPITASVLQISPPPEPTTVPQPPEEEPSQIELSSVEERERQRRPRRPKETALIVDPITYLSSDTIKIQIQMYQDTMRKDKPSDDTIDPEQVRFSRTDFFTPMPLRLRVMADSLLELFRPCDSAAPFPGPKSPLHARFGDTERDASHIQEKDVSAIPSFQDASAESSTRSRSTLLEAHTGIFEETHFHLQPIEEHEAPPMLPPPSTSAEAASTSVTKEPATPKKKHVRKEDGKEGEVDRASPATRDSKTTKPSSQEAASDSSEMSFTEFNNMARMILDNLNDDSVIPFHEMLQEGATDKEAAHLFGLLMQMDQNCQVELQQNEVFGPITISKGSARLD